MSLTTNSLSLLDIINPHRPGLSFIAGALAVELMVALLHSPLGSRHPAPNIHHINPNGKDGGGNGSGKGEEGDEKNAKGKGNGNDEGKEKEKELDLIPHQLRGSLATFTQIAPMVSTDARTSCLNKKKTHRV